MKMINKMKDFFKGIFAVSVIFISPILGGIIAEHINISMDFLVTLGWVAFIFVAIKSVDNILGIIADVIFAIKSK